MRKGPMNRDDLHERVDAMVAATDAFCAEHLTEEFGEMCANLTDELAMHHEDLLERGQPKSWAAGVLYAIARVNFLFDASMEPHMRADELCSLFGVSQETRARRRHASWTPWTSSRCTRTGPSTHARQTTRSSGPFL